MFNANRLYRAREIVAPVGPLPMGLSAFYAGVRDGRIPPGVALGPNLVAWTGDELNEYIARATRARFEADSSPAYVPPPPIKRGRGRPRKPRPYSANRLDEAE